MKNVFITVGTTKFPKLINAITQLNIIQALRKLGCSTVQVQTGRNFDGVKIDPNIKNVLINQNGPSWTAEFIDFNLTIKYDEYFEDFDEQIEKADLVVSHAGAGSCLDVLRLGKPLIVVVNEDLMDNHQTELAQQLEKKGYLYFCTCRTLVNTLSKDFSVLIPYSKPDDKLFSNYLDKCCGFTQ